MKQNRARQSCMKQWIATTAFAAVLLAGGAPAEAAQQVQVTLPTFDVTMNGTTVDNSSRRYPLLVYKDITYVPMTYHDCRFLGLETTWNQQDGLGIIKNDMSGAYYEDTITKKNAKRDKAQIATGLIAVNGKQINNASEQYPLLLYRDVTYFPLTWRFAVDEFGWQYQFSHEAGLVISADNQKTDSLFITDGRTTEEGLTEFDFIINSENLYYQGKDGVIYQRPLNQWQDTGKRIAVAQIPEDSYANGYRHVWFSELQDEVYYTFWYGGASMGGISKYRIGTDQAAYHQSKHDYTDFGDFTIRIDGVQIGGRSAVPMTYIDNKDGRTRTLGEAGYYFYVHPNSYDAKANVLYAKASEYDEATGNTSHASLYKVSVADGGMELYMDVCPDQYAVAGDMLYYWYYTDKVLYAKDLTTGKETVAAAQVNQDIPFAGTANGVYFSSTEAGKQLCYWDKDTGKSTVHNDKGRLVALDKSNEYVIARFEETADNPHRLLVFDPQGRQVYASADVAHKAVVNKNGVLVYQLANMTQLVKVQL